MCVRIVPWRSVQPGRHPGCGIMRLSGRSTWRGLQAQAAAACSRGHGHEGGRGDPWAVWRIRGGPRRGLPSVYAEYVRDNGFKQKEEYNMHDFKRHAVGTAIALTVLLFAAGVTSAEVFATAEGRTIQFKDTEYGFNYKKWYAIWRKPITDSQAAAIRRADVAHLVVPEPMKEANSGYRTPGLFDGPMRKAAPVHPVVSVNFINPQRTSGPRKSFSSSSGRPLGGRVLCSTSGSGLPRRMGGTQNSKNPSGLGIRTGTCTWLSRTAFP